MTMSNEQVHHLARLARIRLTDDEVAQFATQLSEVIEYNIAQLQTVNVEGVAPTAQTTGQTNCWRDDVPHASLPQSVALSAAPSERDGQFVVKQVLGTGS